MNSYKDAKDLGNMLRAAFTFVNKHGGTKTYFDREDIEYNKINIEYYKDNIICKDNEGQILFNIQNTTVKGHRVRIPRSFNSNDLKFIKFFSPNGINSVLSNGNKVINTIEDETIDLIPKVQEGDWDSVKFQLSTIYTDDIVKGLMIEPFVTEAMDDFGLMYKIVLSYDEAWDGLQYEEVTQAIDVMSKMIDVHSPM